MIATLIELLGSCYQSGNFAQVETIARSMLSAIPNDIVALQFLGLALYQLGRVDEAHRVFHRVADKSATELPRHDPAICEPAVVTSYREATRAGSGLAEAWCRIATVMQRLGFHKPALRAFRASLKARTQDGPSCIELRGSGRRLPL